MLSYYDELGVEPSASEEEIRQAYKRLARLLHPDQFAEEALRRLAERQMQRLNQVVAVLMDPAGRRRYDQSLAWRAAPRWVRLRRAVEPLARAAPRQWVWLLAAGLAVGGALYFALEHRGRAEQAPSRPAGAPPAAVKAAPAVAPPAPQAPPRRLASRPPASSFPALATDPPQSASAAGGGVELPEPEVALPAVPRWEALPASLPEGVEPLPSQVAPPPVQASLAGTWLYVPPPLAPQPGLLYPPEYIELRLREQEGVLEGWYRARYQITDRTIWPEVTFQFRGRAEQQVFPWSGEGGARGEVRLQRQGPNALEVTWWASQLGRLQGLASGTAVLLRR